MLTLDQLNEAQRRAVTHGEGPLLVLAGPGSGKTFTITQRIAYLIEECFVPPEQILVITFTRDAALSMQSRFQAQCPYPLPVNFGTFHSVFYHILRESHALQALQLLTEAQKRNFIIPIMEQCLSGEDRRKGSPAIREDAKAMLAAISYFKNTGDEAAAAKSLSKAWLPYFARVREQYGDRCRTCGRVDFDDMVFECRRLLQEDGDMRREWRNRFAHILMDEFQDINPMQYEAVGLLAKPPYNLFAVGDDDQAIYGFRGASPRCLAQFEEDYHADRILLDINYRSSSDIVRASSLMIGENRNRFSKGLRAPAEKCLPSGASVRLKAFTGAEDQYGYLIRQLMQWQEERGSEAGHGAEPECGGKAENGGSAAVLFRTNARMQEAAVRLKKAGINYRMREKVTSIYEHFIVKDIMAYLLLASGDRRRALFLQVMNKPVRYISREALGERETVEWDGVMGFYGRQDVPYRQRVLQELAKWRSQSERIGGMPLPLALQYICRAMGYGDYLKKLSGGNAERLQEWQALLEWLREDAGRHGTVKEWAESQTAYTESLQCKGTPRDMESAPKGGSCQSGAACQDDKRSVQLMTVHGSKGLEFDRVWIPDCNEKVFPHGSMPDEGACEEERRILYVAMTRAKEKLELLYLTGTRERPRLPSRFLNPLLVPYSSTSSSNSQLSRYSSKASATFSYSSSSSI